MGRKKKTEEVPEINIPVDSEVTPMVAKEIEEYPFEDDKPNYVPPAPVKTKHDEDPQIATPESINYAVANVKKYIKERLDNAPKRNDATTMPAVVKLRCRTRDMYFLMPQFDAKTIQKLWNELKDRISPEEFVRYLYSVAGLNPPKLYMFMNTVNII